MKIRLTIIILLFSQSIFGQINLGDSFIQNALDQQKLEEWQTQIAPIDHKNIQHYYLLLPKSLLEGEVPLRENSKENRLQQFDENNERNSINIQNGYLTASPSNLIKLALFKDRINRKDIIAIVVGCGVPPVQMCDYAFLEFNSKNNKWKINKNVFPWEEFNLKNKSQKDFKSKSGNSEPFMPNVILPEYGTTIKVVDAWTPTEVVYELIWTGEKFAIKK